MEIVIVVQRWGSELFYWWREVGAFCCQNFHSTPAITVARGIGKP